MPAFNTVNTDRVLLEAMKVAERNHRYIANNIANADTPNYTPTRLDFQKALRASLEGRGGFGLRTDRPQHFHHRTERPQAQQVAIQSKSDYNKVDMDEEIALLSENSSKYGTYARLLAKRYEIVKSTLSQLNR